MNRHSDYGYTFGGNEAHTRELCARRIRFCRMLARQAAGRTDHATIPPKYTPAFWNGRVAEWLAIGRAIKKEVRS